MKVKLVEMLKKQDFVPTTTDCWTTNGKSYLGVTVHWIANDTLQHESAYLALQRMKGSHTYNAIASALDEVHAEYGIQHKIVRTTTDNGSNFVKAFNVYVAPLATEDDTANEDSEMTWTPMQQNQWTSMRR